MSVTEFSFSQQPKKKEAQMARTQYSLGIEDGVSGVHGSVVLGGLTNETLLVREGNEGGGGEGTLLVGNDLDIVALVGGNARVGGTCGKESRSASSVKDAEDGGLMTAMERRAQERNESLLLVSQCRSSGWSSTPR